MKFFHVNTFTLTMKVSHSRVTLKNLPSNIPTDVGPGYNEELNYYLNANFINVKLRRITCRLFCEVKVRKPS